MTLARKIAALVDPNSAESETQLRNVQEGARTLNREIQILQASTESQLDDGFAALGRQRPDALLVVPTPFFTAQRKRIVKLTARQIPKDLLLSPSPRPRSGRARQ